MILHGNGSYTFLHLYSPSPAPALSLPHSSSPWFFDCWKWPSVAFWICLLQRSFCTWWTKMWGSTLHNSVKVSLWAGTLSTTEPNCMMMQVEWRLEADQLELKKPARQLLQRWRRAGNHYWRWTTIPSVISFYLPDQFACIHTLQIRLSGDNYFVQCNRHYI